MKDNFSRQAAQYAKYRPEYPPELFDFILRHVPGRKKAWDCATGNGQTAKVLARHFDDVFATDISQQQLDNAAQAENIHYSVQPAEQTGFPAGTFDLVTVSQALHWFRFDSFYNEVRRVGKDNGWLAVWAYSLLKISGDIDPIIDDYHFNTLQDYWDDERKYVDEHYQTIPFPFQEIQAPAFSIIYQWTLKDLEGYFTTWSAYQKFVSVNGFHPLDELMNAIRPHWKGEKMRVSFPVTLRMGRIEK